MLIPLMPLMTLHWLMTTATSATTDLSTQHHALLTLLQLARQCIEAHDNIVSREREKASSTKRRVCSTDAAQAALHSSRFIMPMPMLMMMMMMMPMVWKCSAIDSNPVQIKSVLKCFL